MNDWNKNNEISPQDERDFTLTLINEKKPEISPDILGENEVDDNDSTVVKHGAKQPPWVGKIMGHFKLIRKIGEGSMGLVIQAEDINLKRIVALKILLKKISQGKNKQIAVDQFLREARAAAAVEHPNIVRVYEINKHANWWYIAMEMISGNNLKEIVKAAGALPASRACPIIADAAVALQASHEIGIIHRDIKPSNILVTRNGHGKVSDFGLVRVDDPDDPFDSFAHQSIGTPFYMAPELIRKETVSTAVDIYSLGATLFYILTGNPPYDSDNIKDVFRQHLQEEPPDLRIILPGCSENLALTVKRMMAKEPDSRPTAAEVAAILHAETISLSSEIGDAPNLEGSTIEIGWQGRLSKTGTSYNDLSRSTIGKTFAGILDSISIASKNKSIAIAIILTLLCGLSAILYFNYSSRENIESAAKLFPDSPTGYGIKDAGYLPVSSFPVKAPAFSWHGKVNTNGVNFIASRSGLYYYSIKDTRSLLIRADQFIGYTTSAQAENDDKQPHPISNK